MADAAQAAGVQEPRKKRKLENGDAVADAEQSGTAPVEVDAGTAAEAPATGNGSGASTAATAADALAPDPTAAEPALTEPAPETEAPVIKWADALEQCGNEEEFLWELLPDLLDEVRDYTQKIQSHLRSASSAWPEEARRAAHAMKGAAANLMCQEIHFCSRDLEKHAQRSSADDTAALNQARLMAAKLAVASAKLEKFISTHNSTA